MSLGNDFLEDYAFEHDHPFGIPNLPNPVWITKSGAEFPIRNMTLHHIWNCMDLVGEDDAWYGVFEAEVRRRMESGFGR